LSTTRTKLNSYYARKLCRLEPEKLHTYSDKDILHDRISKPGSSQHDIFRMGVYFSQFIKDLDKPRS